MGRRWVMGLVLAALAVAGAARGQGALTHASVPVKILRPLSLSRDLPISFQPGERVRGDFYYAVLVIQRDPHWSRDEPLRCSAASDLEDTEYAYSRRGRPIRLTLLRETPPENDWCPGATYEGAVYAAPHEPPCNRVHPCSSQTSEAGCWEILKRCDAAEHLPHPHKGKIAPLREGSYPQRLPRPLVAHTRVIARFHVHFPAARRTGIAVHVPGHPSTAGGVTISFRPHPALANGGYYYAVAVLTKYYAKRRLPPPCSATSNMGSTEYAYPAGYGSKGPTPISLTLSPGESSPWCPATYKGAIYAVPHAPPCHRGSLCTGPECYEGELRCANGELQPPRGIIPHRVLAPGELPPPRDRSIRTIAYFTIRF